VRCKVAGQPPCSGHGRQAFCQQDRNGIPVALERDNCFGVLRRWQMRHGLHRGRFARRGEGLRRGAGGEMDQQGGSRADGGSAYEAARCEQGGKQTQQSEAAST
jgi:hypothetical protein